MKLTDLRHAMFFYRKIILLMDGIMRILIEHPDKDEEIDFSEYTWPEEIDAFKADVEAFMRYQVEESIEPSVGRRKKSKSSKIESLVTDLLHRIAEAEIRENTKYSSMIDPKKFSVEVCVKYLLLKPAAENKTVLTAQEVLNRVLLLMKVSVQNIKRSLGEQPPWGNHVLDFITAGKGQIQQHSNYLETREAVINNYNRLLDEEQKILFPKGGGDLVTREDFPFPEAVVLPKPKIELDETNFILKMNGKTSVLNSNQFCIVSCLYDAYMKEEPPVSIDKIHRKCPSFTIYRIENVFKFFREKNPGSDWKEIIIRGPRGSKSFSLNVAE